MRLSPRGAAARRDAAEPQLRLRRPTHIFIWLGVALALAIASATGLLLVDQRDRAVAHASRELENLSFVIAEETDRAFQAVQVVQTNLIARMRSQGIQTTGAYARRMSSESVHQMLREAINGLPQVDAITLIDAAGKLINFSRFWPIPDVNIADRDYFKALRDDPEQESFVSMPVPNRGNGSWTIFLARRFSGPKGEFLGLVLGAMPLTYFENFYGRIALSEGSSISLLRKDGVLLARFPNSDPSIGHSLLTEGNFKVILDNLDGGTIRAVSGIDGQDRLIAGHSAARFPLVVDASFTAAATLATWRQQALYTSLLAGTAITIIGLSVWLAVVMMTRQIRSQELAAAARAEQAEALRARAIAEAERETEQQRKALERQLQQFQKVEALGTLASGVAHDINNTLVPILALTKRAASRLPGHSRERENLNIVLQAAEHARDLVRQILAPSREEKIEKDLTDLADVVRIAINMVRPGLAPTAQIDTKIDPVAPLLVHAGKIHRLIINLVTNAAHAIGGDTGTITVGLSTQPRAGDGEGPAVKLTVADTGCGIDQATMDRIFDPFFTTKAAGEGTGLGLAIVHGIVIEHGGQISVESRVGEGTCFTVLLPTADATAVPEPRRAVS
jgi:signal transduction histidine kinase